MTTEALQRLNAMPEQAARLELLRCCGSSRWVERMMARRPFADEAELYRAAESVWNSLKAADWKEAFAAQSAPALQSRLAEAGAMERAALEKAMRDYEERFGYRFVPSAGARSAGELLNTCQVRLANDPLTELFVAAEEQRKVIRQRLADMLQSGV